MSMKGARRAIRWRDLVQLALQAGLLAILLGCSSSGRLPGEPPPGGVARGSAVAADVRVTVAHRGRPYDIAASESLLVIVAFRGGALGKAGHNHVIAAHDLTGTVYVPQDVAQTTFDIHFSVAQLVVDEPSLRALEGSEFPPDIPESARAGTRRNMLSEALLDGDRFPDIRLICTQVEPAAPGAMGRAHVEARVRGEIHELIVPVQYSIQQTGLTASGTFALKQSELGLTPFNALLGALQVQDELRIRFRLVASEAQIIPP